MGRKDKRKVSESSEGSIEYVVERVVDRKEVDGKVSKWLPVKLATEIRSWSEMAK